MRRRRRERWTPPVPPEGMMYDTNVGGGLVPISYVEAMARSEMQWWDTLTPEAKARYCAQVDRINALEFNQPEEA